MPGFSGRRGIFVLRHRRFPGKLATLRVVAPVELKQQFDLGIRLLNLVSRVNQSLRDLEQFEAQLEAIEKPAEVAAMKNELVEAFLRF